MNKEYLIQQLNNIETAKRVNRMRVAQLVLKNKELFYYLLDIVFKFDEKISIKAAWVLEFVCNEELDWLSPHLQHFTDNIGKVKFDSAVRPVAKICEFLAKAHVSKKTSEIKKKITDAQIERMIETGFDWLIGEHKVAVKAYTMEMLFLFGKNNDWVHEELYLVIQQHIAEESAAYKARGKKILGLIQNCKSKPT